MNIIFCRHGETEFNLFDRFQGVSDSPLTERGENQARSINAFLTKNYSVGKFFISPLNRVIQTFEFASKGIDASLEIVQELREVCYGDWETKRREQINPFLLELKSRNKFNYIHPGSFNNVSGESYKMQYERVTPFLKKLEQLNENKDIVVITHQGILTSVYKYFNNLDESEIQKFKNSNHQALVVNLKDGKSKVSQIEL